MAMLLLTLGPVGTEVDITGAGPLPMVCAGGALTSPEAVMTLAVLLGIVTNAGLAPVTAAGLTCNCDDVTSADAWQI